MAIITMAERRLIKEMQRALGASLCKFLLAGYGNDEIVQTRFFSILSKGQLVEKKILIRLTTLDPLGLPCKKEPLVLLALLQRLEYKDEQTVINPIVPFPTSDIWSVLEWENSDETHRTIHSALRKYFNLSYTRINDQGHSFPDATGFTGSTFRLIVSYMFSDESDSGEWGDDMECMEIEFNQTLAEEIQSRQFLGMNWDSISSIKSSH